MHCQSFADIPSDPLRYGKIQIESNTFGYKWMVLDIPDDFGKPDPKRVGLIGLVVGGIRRPPCYYNGGRATLAAAASRRPSSLALRAVAAKRHFQLEGQSQRMRPVKRHIT